MPKQCRHVKASGVQCRAYRVWKEDYCFFHLHHRTPQGIARRSEERPAPPLNGVGIPLLEDVTTVQLVLQQVLAATAAGAITAAQSNVLIRGLRLAAQNLKNESFAGKNPLQPGVECFVQYENGDVLGPEQFASEQQPEHPLMESGILGLRHLAERLEYEARIDAYLLQGQQPPDDLPVPSPRPSGDDLLDWIKTGWQCAQSRAHAIDRARRAIDPPPADAPALSS
jgi:hypothetical protein